MAKKTPQTLEQVEAEIASLLASRKELFEEQQTINKKIIRNNDLLQTLEKLRFTFVPMTLETALEAYLESGENAEGYKWLDTKSYKGDWAGTGVRMASGYWPKNNQRAITVWSNHDWDNSRLVEQERIILDIVPALKAGTIGKEQMIKLDAKGKDQVDLNKAKVFEIFDKGCSQHNNWNLAQLEDGRWAIYDSYNIRYSFSNARKVGTLAEMLVEIRDYLYYEGGPARTDDDEDEL
jgi:hypothetical protein